MDTHYFQLGRHDQDFLHAQWVSLASRYASDLSAIENLFNSIVEHYSAKNRAYHNLSHIQSLLSLSESLPDKIQSRDAFYFAIWFHDLIYDTKSSDNEEKSAEFAVEALAGLGVPEQTIAVTREMILATKHHRADDLSWDVKAFLDLDTSILGAPEDIYKEYSRAIRKEYSWVPGFLYRKGRMKVLNDFLEREFIYCTEEIRMKYEMQARRNIAEEVSNFRSRRAWRTIAISLVALLSSWLPFLAAGVLLYAGESASRSADTAMSQPRRSPHQHLPPSEYEPNDKLAASSYRLKIGDTLQEIGALRYGHRYYSGVITLYNHIENERRVKSGATLKLPGLSDILAEEGFTKVAAAETELILCSRAKYDKVVNRLGKLRLGAGSRTVVVPEDIKLALLEAADDLERAAAGLMANKPGVIQTPKSLIGKLRANAASMRNLAAGANDGYGYDIDMVQQNYALALTYAIIWTREGFR